MLSLALVAATTGCTDDGDAPDAGPTTTPPPATTSPPTTGATATATGDGLDCDAVEQARQDLTDATNAELDRLGVDRSDPRAFSVQVLVTSQQAAEYWTTLRDAVPPSRTDLLADADTVVSYWEPLNEELDSITIADGDEASVQEATDRYLEISAAHPVDDVLPAQERLTAGIEEACAEPTT